MRTFWAILLVVSVLWGCAKPSPSTQLGNANLKALANRTYVDLEYHSACNPDEASSPIQLSVWHGTSTITFNELGAPTLKPSPCTDELIRIDPLEIQVNDDERSLVYLDKTYFLNFEN